MTDEHKCEVDWSTFSDLRAAVCILKDVVEDVVFELQTLSTTNNPADILAVNRMKRKLENMSRYL